MTTITKEWLQKTITSIESARDEIPFGLDEDQSNMLTAFKIALASLEAKPIGAFHIAEQQVDGTSDYLKDGEWPIDNGTIEVYAAPPVPVVPEEKPMPNPLSMYAVDAVAATAEVRGWNACRAAMLHGAEPVSQTYKLTFEQWLEQQHDKIDVDCGCVSTEMLMHWIRVAYEAGNSPVTPDGWVMVPKELTPEMMRAVQIRSELGGYATSNLSGAYNMFSEFWNVAVSAAPKVDDL